MQPIPSIPPCRPTLRKLLNKLFVLEADFNALVIDCFPWLNQRMSSGPDRISRVNLLFELVEPEQLWAVLKAHYSSELLSHPHLLSDDVKQSAAAQRRQAWHQALTQLRAAAEACRAVKNPTEQLEAEMLELRRKLRRGRQVEEQSLLLNRYRILEKLGEGGFATVWLAQNCDPKAAGTGTEFVAIKVLLGHHHDNEAVLRRFQRGARSMQELDHPHIVQVIEGPQEDDELHFFAMEYLAGGDLRQMVTGGTLSSDKLIEIIQQIGCAVHYAHEQGHIHRDVTPANILLNPAGLAKLSDFDLVLRRDSSTIAGRTSHGTLAYAAPEQLDKLDFDSNDPTVDVYGLAMTTLYALTGREIPVHRRELMLLSVIDSTAHGQPIKDVLHQALAGQPADRHSTVKEFCLALGWAWDHRSDLTVFRELRDTHPGTVFDTDFYPQDGVTEVKFIADITGDATKLRLEFLSLLIQRIELINKECAYEEIFLSHHDIPQDIPGEETASFFNYTATRAKKLLQETARFSVNDLVVHEKYGQGRVIKVRDSDGHEMVTIDFRKLGIKTILSTYLASAEYLTSTELRH